MHSLKNESSCNEHQGKIKLARGSASHPSHTHSPPTGKYYSDLQENHSLDFLYITAIQICCCR